MRRLSILTILAITATLSAQDQVRKKADGNRLAYLDELDPYYPHRDFPKLITPQWVGDKDVECVVVLAIDDMRDTKKYETFLRPILRRLKEIDGRAPVSIMTCKVDPLDPQLQDWLKEGLSLECHTVDHPCPFFKQGFAKAKDTYDRCVDLMNAIPNNKPVAFRMPCCDSLNTPSPRFWAEIFNKTTEKGNFLLIDSSVCNVFTSADPELPRTLVLDDKGQERFTRYLPTDRTFVNTIKNYPYPYVIGRLCWEFPCVTPSDWLAQHFQKANNPDTVRDLKAALDCAVVKKGVFCLIFHPHGWIRNDQVVELIDHAVATHGKKVKFLTFKEAQERLSKNLLEGDTLRAAASKVRLDYQNSDFVGISFNGPGKLTQKKRWDGKGQWVQGTASPDSTSDNIVEPLTVLPVQLRGSTQCYLMSNRQQQVVMLQGPKAIYPAPFALPDEAVLGGKDGKDAGFRLIDLDGDGNDDILFSNEKEYGIYLFTDMEKGWSKKIMAGKRGDKDALPMISRDGTNNGFWVHSGHLWWSNEDTVLLQDHVDRRSIKELLGR